MPESHQEVMRSYTFSKGKARYAHINMNLCNEEPGMAGRSAGVGICTEAYKLGAAQKQYESHSGWKLGYPGQPKEVGRQEGKPVWLQQSLCWVRKLGSMGPDPWGLQRSSSMLSIHLGTTVWSRESHRESTLC